MEGVGENGIPFVIVFTKLDKQSKSRWKENKQKYIPKLLEQWEELAPIFETSSEEKKGREELLNWIEGVNKTL